MALTMEVSTETLQLREPFRIAGHVFEDAAYFLMLAGLAGVAALLLHSLDPPLARVMDGRGD